MKISELIAELETIKFKHGDIDVKVQTLTHTWPPEPEVKGTPNDSWVLLNP